MPDPAETKAYTEWALRICGEVERAAAAMHERGVVFNDLHMFNIIVRPDDTVAFIDFEAASDISEGRVRTVGNPGFAALRVIGPGSMSTPTASRACDWRCSCP